MAYGEQAAERASLVYAHGDVVRFLERAIEVHEMSDPGDLVKRCDLLLALGSALILSGAPRRAVDVVGPAAFSLAERLDDANRAFSAAMLVLDALPPLGATSAVASPEFLRWAEIADRYAQPASIQRPLADNALASAWSMRGRRREARALWNRALASARVLDDPGVMFEIVWRLIQLGFPTYWSEQVALANEFSDRPRDRVSPRLLGNVLLYCAIIQLAEGQYDRFEQTLRESTRIHWRGYPVLISCSPLERPQCWPCSMVTCTRPWS